MKRIRLAGLVCSMLILTSLAACASSAGERGVFGVVIGSDDGIRATTVDVVDVGVPLTNTTGFVVALRRISLVSVPRAVHLKSVTAYGPEMNIGLSHGDLLRYCRKADTPYPVTADRTGPHAGSPWRLVLAVTFAKPGTYHLRRAKIFYVTDGHSGWQYLNLDTTATVTAAGSGTKPSMDGC